MSLSTEHSFYRREWTPEQDIELVRLRRVQREPFKRVAHAMSRNIKCVHQRYHKLESLLEAKHGDVLKRHREEELELMRQLLRELKQEEAYERERAAR